MFFEFRMHYTATNSASKTTRCKRECGGSTERLVHDLSFAMQFDAFFKGGGLRPPFIRRSRSTFDGHSNNELHYLVKNHVS